MIAFRIAGRRASNLATTLLGAGGLGRRPAATSLSLHRGGCPCTAPSRSTGTRSWSSAAVPSPQITTAADDDLSASTTRSLVVPPSPAPNAADDDGPASTTPSLVVQPPPAPAPADASSASTTLPPTPSSGSGTLVAAPSTGQAATLRRTCKGAMGWRSGEVLRRLGGGRIRLRQEATVGVTLPLIVFSGSQRSSSTFASFVSRSGKSCRPSLLHKKLTLVIGIQQQTIELLKDMEKMNGSGIDKILGILHTLTKEQATLLDMLVQHGDNPVLFTYDLRYFEYELIVEMGLSWDLFNILFEIKEASSMKGAMKAGLFSSLFCFLVGALFCIVSVLAMYYFGEDFPGLEESKTNIIQFLLSILKNPEVRTTTESYAEMFASAIWMAPISWIRTWLRGKANEGLVVTCSEFSNVATSFAYTVYMIIYRSNGSCEEGDLMEQLRLLGFVYKELCHDLLSFLTRKGYLNKESVVVPGVIYNSTKVMYSVPISSLVTCTSGKMKKEIAEAVAKRGTFKDMMS
ncbi:hypothetical protein EJB05_14055, partial [Eragrostis curvula]